MQLTVFDEVAEGVHAHRVFIGLRQDFCGKKLTNVHKFL